MSKLPKTVREIGAALAKGGFNDLSPKAQAWVVARINEHGYAPEIKNLGGLRDASFGAFAVGMGHGAPPYARTPMGAADRVTDAANRAFGRYHEEAARRLEPVYVAPINDAEDDGFSLEDEITSDDGGEFEWRGLETFHQIFDYVPQWEPPTDDEGYEIEPWNNPYTNDYDGSEGGTFGAGIDVGLTPAQAAIAAQRARLAGLRIQAAQQQALLAQQQQQAALLAQQQAAAPAAADPMATMAQMQQMQMMAQMMNPAAQAPAAAPPMPDPSMAAPPPAPTDTGTPAAPVPHRHHRKGLFKRIEEFFAGDEDESSDAPDTSGTDIGFGDGFDYYNYPNCGPLAGKTLSVPQTASQAVHANAQKTITAYTKKYCGSTQQGDGVPYIPTFNTSKPSSNQTYYLTPVCNAGPTPGKRFSYKAGHQAAAQQLYAAYQAKWCSSVPGYNPSTPYTPGYDPQQAQLDALQAQLAMQQQANALAQSQQGFIDPSLAAPATAAPADPMAMMAEMQQMQAMTQMMNPGAAPAVPAYAPAPSAPAPVPTDTGTPAPTPKKHKSLFKRIEDFFLGDEDETPDTGATAIEHGLLDNPTKLYAQRALAMRVSGVASFESLEKGAAALVDVARRVTAEPTAPAPSLIIGNWTDTAYDVATNPFVSPAGWLVKKGTDWFDGPSSEATEKYQQLRADWAGYESQGVASHPDLGQDIAEWGLFKSQWEAGTIPSADIGGRLTGEVLRSNRVRASLVEKATNKFTAPQDLPHDQLTPGLDVTHATGPSKASVPIDAAARATPILNDITKPTTTPGLGTPFAPGVLGKILWYTAAGAAGVTALVIGKDVLVARLSK